MFFLVKVDTNRAFSFDSKVVVIKYMELSPKEILILNLINKTIENKKNSNDSFYELIRMAIDIDQIE